jgi:hypothetical protein
MTDLKTLEGCDGRRRIVNFQRDDGLFGFREERIVRTSLGERWGTLARYSTICATAEIAEREARAAIAWLLHSS